ncbi:MAG TPA: SH3-like domain-containing protein [Rhodopila sp.]|jgi:nitrile hydratase
MFSAGETVRVKDQWPEATGPVHIRTPHYIRGVVGEVVRHLGDFPNPEDLAFARPAALRPLYHVRFRKGEIWPEAKPDDELLIEIYGHWLERP